MHIFLTSQPYGTYRGERPAYNGFNPKNRFEEEIKRLWRDKSAVLMISSDPDDYPMIDCICDDLKSRIEGSGLTYGSFTACDHRSGPEVLDHIENYDAIFLSGGHVPTAYNFYREIGLPEKINTFKGILVGISAGSMLSAREIYIQPELPGETGPDFVKFREGLGLINATIIPHYQTTKDDILDGRRLFEDITYPDSMGKSFYLLYDGTYIYRDSCPGGKTLLRGRALLLRDGEAKLLQEDTDETVI